jgi:hypothetical protein
VNAPKYDRKPQRHRLNDFEHRFDLVEERISMIDEPVTITCGLDLNQRTPAQADRVGHWS